MKRILSIDGGGMRGYMPAALLVELERRTGHACCEIFDLIAGTSIGGILAALLAVGVPADEAIKFFTLDGPLIFKKRWWNPWGLLHPRYSGQVIEDVLQARFLAEDQVHTQLLITSLNLVTGKPFFFRYGQGHHGSLWQAARATSAAQTYFPAFRTQWQGQDFVFWDGGNVCNNPAMCAYAESQRLLWHEEIQIVSLGCGDAPAKIAPFNLVNASLPVNGLVTMEMLFQAGSEEVDFQLNQILGDHYLRLRPVTGGGLPLDGASPADLANLRDGAVNFLERSYPRLENFLYARNN